MNSYMTINTAFTFINTGKYYRALVSIRYNASPALLCSVGSLKRKYT